MNDLVGDGVQIDWRAREFVEYIHGYLLLRGIDGLDNVRGTITLLQQITESKDQGGGERESTTEDGELR